MNAVPQGRALNSLFGVIGLFLFGHISWLMTENDVFDYRASLFSKTSL